MYPFNPTTTAAGKICVHAVVDAYRNHCNVWAFGVAFTSIIVLIAILMHKDHSNRFARDFSVLLNMGDEELDEKARRKFRSLRVPPNAIVEAPVKKSTFSFGRGNKEFKLKLTQLPANVIPLLCFVNPKSGGNQGQQVVKILSKLLHPVQVVSLTGSVDPMESLNQFSAISSHFRVLVCGGDGSVGWVLNCISKMARNLQPAVAIMPLGTGNDLARSIGWGHTIENSMIPSVLDSCMHASTILLDRWQMTIKSGDKIVKKSAFVNYCGFGVDAQVAHKFHLDRNSRPDRFVYQFLNKIWYGVLGFREIWKQSCKGIFKNMKLYADGKLIEIPEDTEGLIFCNISSYGAGVKLWNDDKQEDVAEYDSNDLSSSSSTTYGTYSSSNLSSSTKMRNSNSPRRRSTAEPSSSPSPTPSSPTSSIMRRNSTAGHGKRPRPQSVQDGYMECMAVTGTFHLAQIRFDLDNATKLCQGKRFSLVVLPADLKKSCALPIQTDGEPWIESNLTATSGHVVEIERLDQSLMLERTPDGRDSDLGSEIINWAYQEGRISFQCKQIMQREFSRRLEERHRSLLY